MGVSESNRIAPTGNRSRLEFLDGIRGLAALYVVLFHTWQAVCYFHGDIPGALWYSLTWMAFGRSAVAVFIVLSGYCLMLPVARSGDGKLRGGVVSYLQRRGWRILPPYYAAFLLSLLALWLAPPLSMHFHWWYHMDTAFTPGVLLSHLFLIHNLHPDWVYKINSPLWSVATEWQIYFAFPILLILWRRWGIAVALFASIAARLALRAVFPVLEGAAPWMLGLFGMGMAAAVVGHGSAPRMLRLVERAPWGVIAGLLFGVFIAWGFGLIFKRQDVTKWQTFWYTDLLVGAATSSLILYCTRLRSVNNASVPLVLRLFEARPSMALGKFSYSLYLVHGPVLGIFHFFIQKLHLPNIVNAGVLLTGGITVCIGIGYLFHLGFERRFLTPQPARPDAERRTSATVVASISK